MKTKYDIGDVLIIYDESCCERFASNVVGIEVDTEGIWYRLHTAGPGSGKGTVVQEQTDESHAYRIVGKIGTLFTECAKED